MMQSQKTPATRDKVPRRQRQTYIGDDGYVLGVGMPARYLPCARFCDTWTALPKKYCLIANAAMIDNMTDISVLLCMV